MPTDSRSTLDLYLDRAARGDRSIMPKLCSRLADRLVYVPAGTERAGGKEERRVVVEVPVSDSGEVFVFTSETFFRRWRDAQKPGCRFLLVFGADIPLLVSAEVVLHVNPGSHCAVKLPPKSLAVQYEQAEEIFA